METTETWQVRLDVVEHDDASSAHAVLTTAAGTTMHGRGRARRNPADHDVPQIGAEVAAARALRDLADTLLRAASDDIAAELHEEVHLTS